MCWPVLHTALLPAFPLLTADTTAPRSFSLSWRAGEPTPVFYVVLFREWVHTLTPLDFFGTRGRHRIDTRKAAQGLGCSSGAASTLMLETSEQSLGTGRKRQDSSGLTKIFVIRRRKKVKRPYSSLE